ncbi:MAG: hypothetical protein ACXAEN_25400 [Candidatus Thorarchaeota archaeon]
MVSSPHIVYSDLDSEKMIKWRKLNLMIGSTTFPIFTLLLIFGIWGRAIARGYVNSVEIAVIWVIVTVVMVVLFYFKLVDGERRAWKYGVILDENALKALGRDIPIDSILKAEMVVIGRTKRYFAVGYLVRKKERRKLRAFRLWEVETNNAMELCNEIRELKGWLKQTHLHTTTWRDWKASLRGLKA